MTHAMNLVNLIDTIFKVIESPYLQNIYADYNARKDYLAQKILNLAPDRTDHDFEAIMGLTPVDLLRAKDLYKDLVEYPNMPAKAMTFILEIYYTAAGGKPEHIKAVLESFKGYLDHAPITYYPGYLHL